MTATLLLAFAVAADGPPTLRDRLARLPVPPTSPVVQGVLLGHALAPGGWPAVRAVLADPDLHFAVRFAGLKMLPALRAAAPDVLTDKERAATLTALLEQPDFADLVIDHLRRAEDRGLTPAVLKAFARPGAVPVVRRAVLVYALACPDPAAKALLADVRTTDPELVKKAEAAYRQTLEPAPKPEKEKP